MSNPYPGQVTSKRIVVFLRCTCGFNGLAALNGCCPNCGHHCAGGPAGRRQRCHTARELGYADSAIAAWPGGAANRSPSGIVPTSLERHRPAGANRLATRVKSQAEAGTGTAAHLRREPARQSHTNADAACLWKINPRFGSRPSASTGEAWPCGVRRRPPRGRSCNRERTAAGL